MRVLGIVGSPRHNGNTQILVEQILKGAEEEGAEVVTLELSHARIRECDGCNQCWKGDACVKNDDMNQYYLEIAHSDVIVFGTPVYWYGPSALMKGFLDRFVYFNCPENRPMVKGKRAILAVPFEENDLETADPLIRMFRKSLAYLEMELQEIILAPGVLNKGEVTKKRDIMEAAKAAGKRSVR
ncbi:MAG: Iron-sulfur flavoprotein [Methanomassiliicoccales archaeon PtaU1.Bin124]|nr:MAG: Iron-sulfur flavoprotein [Methanomassiliicoccales archaeon PtaU1.Bin124]